MVITKNGLLLLLHTLKSQTTTTMTVEVRSSLKKTREATTEGITTTSMLPLLLVLASTGARRSDLERRMHGFIREKRVV